MFTHEIIGGHMYILYMYIIMISPDENVDTNVHKHMIR